MEIEIEKFNDLKIAFIYKMGKRVIQIEILVLKT